jgi:hypothetical protein
MFGWGYLLDMPPIQYLDLLASARVHRVYGQPFTPGGFGSLLDINQAELYSGKADQKKVSKGMTCR